MTEQKPYQGRNAPENTSAVSASSPDFSWSVVTPGGLAIHSSGGEPLVFSTPNRSVTVILEVPSSAHVDDVFDKGSMERCLDNLVNAAFELDSHLALHSALSKAFKEAL